MMQETVINKKTVAGSFGRAASSYDAYADLQRQSVLDLVAKAPPGPYGQILDLGSGTGFGEQVLSMQYPQARIYSLDIAMQMLLYARNKNFSREQTLVCGDAEALPFQAHCFDLVFSSLTIQWCSHYPLLFSEIARILKPGGTAIISTFGPATLQELRQAWRAVDDQVHVNDFRSGNDLVAAVPGGQFSKVMLETGHITRHYEDLGVLTTELKAIGANTLPENSRRGMTGKSSLQKLRQAFQAGEVPGEGVPVTYELIYLLLSR